MLDLGRYERKSNTKGIKTDIIIEVSIKGLYILDGHIKEMLDDLRDV